MNIINCFHPLHKSLTVAKSKIHGLGIIATDDIDTEVDLGISHVKNADYKDGLIRTPLGGFLNHSDKPNTYYKIEGNNFRLITLRQIEKGEEITVSYRNYYSDKVLDSFK